MVSDSSLYIDEIAKDGVEYLRFSLDNIQEIPDIVNSAVHREDIANRGICLYAVDICGDTGQWKSIIILKISLTIQVPYGNL